MEIEAKNVALILTHLPYWLAAGAMIVIVRGLRRRMEGIAADLKRLNDEETRP